MSRQNTLVGSYDSGRRMYSQNQRGAVLVFALIVLLVMTVLAVSGIGNSTLEQRMAGNYSQSMTTFESAEQGLRVVEEWLFAMKKNNATFRKIDDPAWWFKSTSNADGLYTSMYLHPDDAKVCKGVDGCVFDPRYETHWCADMAKPNCKLPKGFITLGDNLKGRTLSKVGDDWDGDGTIDSVARQPQFIIEYIGPVGNIAKNITFDEQSMDAPQQAFRITLIAWGLDAATRKVLQSHVLLTL